MRSVTVNNNDLRFYPTPESAWQAMYDDCAAAEHSIEIEQYILNDDATGQWFMKLFTEKASHGVDVRLVLDGIGSRSFYGKPALIDFQKKGGKVHFYNRPHWWGIPMVQRWLPRNHAKVMTVDWRVGYVGGVCVAEEMKDWRDLHVRVEGNLIADMKKDFSRFWAMLEGTKRHYHALRYMPTRALQYLTKHPALRINPLYRRLLKRIKSAKKQVLIASPYFVPPRGLKRALLKAAERGVKVTVLISHTSDVTFVDKVTRSYLPSLLRHKIEVLLFKPTVFHAKYMLVDDNWAAIGSTNIDHLSILQNREASLVTTDSQSVRLLAAHFAADAAESRKANMHDWRGLSWRDRVIGRIGRLFRRVL